MMTKIVVLAAGVSLAGLAVLHAADAADYSVAATGRCVFADAGGIQPVPGAEVELRDMDFAPADSDVSGPLPLVTGANDLCASGTANEDGRFNLAGSCHPSTKLEFQPQLYVRCSLAGDAGRVLDASDEHRLYNAVSAIGLPGERRLKAVEIALPSEPAREFIELIATSVKLLRHETQSFPEEVWAFAPDAATGLTPNSGQTYFASYAGAVFMTIAKGAEGGTTAHEYGHTLQFQSYLNDWTRINSVLKILKAGWAAIEHATGQGHNFSVKTDPVTAYAEAFADVVESQVAPWQLPDCRSWQVVGKSQTDQNSVEGNIFCWLERLRGTRGLRRILEAQQQSRATTFLELLPTLAN